MGEHNEAKSGSRYGLYHHILLKIILIIHFVEEKRRKALAERRLARERKIEESLHIWEKNIVPDWRVVYKNPELRKLWWSGIPSKLRGTMWERAIGNALALGKGNIRFP